VSARLPPFSGDEPWETQQLDGSQRLSSSGIAGWLAEQFMKSDMRLLMNIMLGIVGAASQRHF